MRSHSTSSSSSSPASNASAKQIYQCAQLTLGIETAHDHMCVVIPRGTALPCSATQLFSTYTDEQQGVSIQVYQGERAVTRDNQFLGQFELTDLRRAPRGAPKIAVTFHLNEYGDLTVEAHESLNGRTENLSVLHELDPPSKYWQFERVAQALQDAQVNRDADDAANQRIAAKSKFEQYMWGLHSTLDKNMRRNILSKDETAAIGTAHDAAISWVKQLGDNATTQQFEEKLEQIQRQCQTCVRKLYQTAGSNAGGVPNTSFTSPGPLANTIIPEIREDKAQIFTQQPSNTSSSLQPSPPFQFHTSLQLPSTAAGGNVMLQQMDNHGNKIPPAPATVSFSAVKPQYSQNSSFSLFQPIPSSSPPTIAVTPNRASSPVFQTLAGGTMPQLRPIPSSLAYDPNSFKQPTFSTSQYFSQPFDSSHYVDSGVMCVSESPREHQVDDLSKDESYLRFLTFAPVGVSPEALTVNHLSTPHHPNNIPINDLKRGRGSAGVPETMSSSPVAIGQFMSDVFDPLQPSP